MKRRACKLPAGFESGVRTAAAAGMIGSDDGQSDAVESVIRRAKRLSDRGKLIGTSASDIESAIYGSALLWLFLWRYRSLIWFVIRTLAELAWQNRERDENEI